MIGIFDSGIGGMTVARAVEQLLPEYSIVYFGDIARTPYGSKSAATITDYSLRNTEFLLRKGAEIIIIACNTASSVATEALRREFQVPIIEVESCFDRDGRCREKYGRPPAGPDVVLWLCRCRRPHCRRSAAVPAGAC